MRKNKHSLLLKVFLIKLSIIILLVTNPVNTIKPSEAFFLTGTNVSGKNLFSKFRSNQQNYDSIVEPFDDTEPIFWDIDDNANITYNPIVLFLNYYYWDNLPFYTDGEEYLIEISANETVLVNSSDPYSAYNEFYWDLGYDWNISQYSPGSFFNLTVFFFQETNPNLNHTASIGITIQELFETPEIDLENFIIDLFHWPGSYYSSGGGYWYFDPDNVNPYYHFAIYQDGYIEFKYGDRELFDSKDLSASEAQTLMQELIDLGFFQLRDIYLAPGYDYFYQSYYQIYIQSRHIQEWRQAEETRDFIVKPQQFQKCLDAIFDRVENLDFSPKRWKWTLFFAITGGSLGGLGVLISAFYVFTQFRRRR